MDLEELHTAVSDLAKLYQFRSSDETLYFGLSVAQAYTLRALWLHGGMTMTRLAEQVTIAVSTMTGVVDQLVARRLVERTPDPTDLRRFDVALTPRGRKTYEKGNAEFMLHLRSTTRGYSERDLEVVRRFLVDLAEVIADWRGLRASAPAATGSAR